MESIIISIIVPIIVALLGYFGKKLVDWHKSNSIYKWIMANTSQDKMWRTTQAIASNNHIPDVEVERLCIMHKKIFRSTGNQKNLWSTRVDRNNTNPDRGFFDI